VGIIAIEHRTECELLAHVAARAQKFFRASVQLTPGTAKTAVLEMARRLLSLCKSDVVRRLSQAFRIVRSVADGFPPERGVYMTIQPATMSRANGARGFAAMDQKKQKEIARRGGLAAQALGTAHRFSPEEARQAGRKGGEAVSGNRQHMASIGRRGGVARHALRKSQGPQAANQEVSPLSTVVPVETVQVAAADDDKPAA
jgi:general stress protein YciG